MDKTYEDLKEAFAGESQASRKYYHFSVVADQEGFPQVARLFRAAAVAETIHAGNHLKAMDGCEIHRRKSEGSDCRRTLRTY